MLSLSSLAPDKTPLPLGLAIASISSMYPTVKINYGLFVLSCFFKETPYSPCSNTNVCFSSLHLHKIRSRNRIKRNSTFSCNCLGKESFTCNLIYIYIYIFELLHLYQGVPSVLLRWGISKGTLLERSRSKLGIFFRILQK